MSNLWDENRSVLNLDEQNGVVPILALAADGLTENVFLITEDHKPIVKFDTSRLESFIEKLKATLMTETEFPLSRNLGQSIVETEDHEYLLEHPLLIKKRNLCQTLDEKLDMLQHFRAQNDNRYFV